MLRFSYHEYLSSRKRDRIIMYRLIVSTIIVVLFDKEGDLKQ